MPAFHINTRFFPIRLTAFMKNDVELSVEAENLTEAPLWTECDVVVPSPISLAPDRDLQAGRIRIGIINPKETKAGRCKIYAGAKSYPERYDIKLVVFGYGDDGAIAAREEKKIELRCERLGT